MFETSASPDFFVFVFKKSSPIFFSGDLSAMASISVKNGKMYQWERMEEIKKMEEDLMGGVDFELPAAPNVTTRLLLPIDRGEGKMI